jgi:hypothetical protein
MNFRTHVEGPINTNFASMQGHIQATLCELVRVFGKPRADLSTPSTFYYWQIKFEDDSIATIYDWREEKQPAPTEVISWHIGGFNSAAAIKVHEAFREALQLRRAA